MNPVLRLKRGHNQRTMDLGVEKHRCKKASETFVCTLDYLQNKKKWPETLYVIYVILRDLRDFPKNGFTWLYVIYVILRGTYRRETLKKGH